MCWILHCARPSLNTPCLSSCLTICLIVWLFVWLSDLSSPQPHTWVIMCWFKLSLISKNIASTNFMKIFMFGLHRHNPREFRQIWEINVKSIELLTRKSVDMGVRLQLKIVTYWLQWGVNDMTWLWCGDLVIWWWPLWNGELVPVEPWLEPLLEPLWPARWGQLSFWWKGNLGTFRSHSSLGTFDFMRPLMSHCFAGMECLLIRENVNPSGGRSNWTCSSMWSRLSSSMWSRLRPRCFNHSLDLSPIPVLNLDFHRTDVENSTQCLSFSKQCHKIYVRDTN